MTNAKNHIPSRIEPFPDTWDRGRSSAVTSSLNGSGLKKAKLGIDGTGEQNSKLLELPQLRKENPPKEPGQGVDGSTRKEENDDLHDNAGDWASQIMLDPVPKLISWSRHMDDAENNSPLTSNSPELLLSRTFDVMRFFSLPSIHECSITDSM